MLSDISTLRIQPDSKDLPKHTWQIFRVVLRTAVACGVIFYLYTSDAIRLAAIRSLAGGWKAVGLAFLILLAALVVTAARLCVLMRPQGFSLTLGSSMRLGLIGTFFNVCLPGGAGGDVVRVYYASVQSPGRRIQAASIIVLDRIAGLFALLCWPLLMAPLCITLIRAHVAIQVILFSAALIAGGMLLAAIIALQFDFRTSGLAHSIFKRVPLGAHFKTAFDTFRAYRVDPGPLLTAVALSLLAHSMVMSAMIVMAGVLHPEHSVREMLLLMPLGFLANSLPITPGGIGIGEAAFDALFRIAGMARGAELLIGWRVLMVLLSLIGLAIYLRGKSSFLSTSIPETLHNSSQVS